MRRKTQDEFIADARKVHGNAYDYSVTEYFNCTTKVEIRCKTHGNFSQTPMSHIRGRGCPLCGFQKTKIALTKTNSFFIKKAKEVHGDKYDYSTVVYIGTEVKVKILCKEHGYFKQRPNRHIQGDGCPSCGREKRNKALSLGTDKFIEKGKNIYGNTYNYSKVNYRNMVTKVTIICKIHGEFKIIPSDHLRGYGCSMCSGYAKLNNGSFVKKARAVHGDKYDYSLVNYINGKTKVTIICPEHGKFKQVAASHHVAGYGCPKCGDIQRAISSTKITTDEFIQRAQATHGNKYDYTNTVYKRAKIKVQITCPKHGLFNQLPYNHLFNAGCPSCNSSKGELKIEEILNILGVKYETQKRFDACKRKKTLPFDFFIPAKKLLVEYDGHLHFIPVDFFGGAPALVKTKENDKIKTAFAQKQDYRLLRIKYTDYERIEELLLDALGDLKPVKTHSQQLSLFAA